MSAIHEVFAYLRVADQHAQARAVAVRQGHVVGVGIVGHALPVARSPGVATKDRP